MNSVENMKSEKRTKPRFDVGASVGMAFYNGGELYSGNVVNLSAEGACLKVSAAGSAAMPTICKDRSMECYLATPRGRSKCRGSVKWLQISQKSVMWGISFVELSPDTNDPFRTLINEICFCDRSDTGAQAAN